MKKATISMIAAMDKGRVIANSEGKLPWGSLPADKDFYLDKIKGHTIVMGSTTYRAADHSRAGNRIVVLSRRSRDELGLPEEVELIHEPKDIESLVLQEGKEEIFVTGGGEVYKAMLPFADKIYLTRVDMETPQDSKNTTFPELGEEWKRVKEEKHQVDTENRYPYTFGTYVKNES